MLIDDVQQAMFAAMKARRSDETGALRLALNALRTATKEAGRDLRGDEAVRVLQHEVKNRRQAEQVYRDAGRADRADQEAFQDEAIAASGASSPRELGKVMGRVMPAVRGRADGNRVRQLVLERLQG